MLVHTGLYFNDPYARSFDARVINVDGTRVALDRTVFCPGEGGQSPDRGWLSWSFGKTNVARVRAENGFFWHYIDGTPPPINTPIQGELDWTYRHRMMRTHTSLHLLNAISFYVSGAQNISCRVTPKGIRLGYRGSCWNKRVARDIEHRANEAISASVPVYTYELSYAEARETPLLNQSKLALMKNPQKTVRVVEIEGIALDFDTGTHVRSTTEIGQIQFSSIQEVGPCEVVVDVHLANVSKQIYH
jgi:misacylated tRNA(Ala) deacylase